jgi:hypothetical protein
MLIEWNGIYAKAERVIKTWFKEKVLLSGFFIEIII